MPDPRRLFQDAGKATIRSDDKEQERFGIQEQRLRYSARVMFEGQIVSDNLFSTREEAMRKASQIEKLTEKGVFTPGTTASVVDTFEEAS